MSTNTNVLREYAEGRIQHLNRGQCPDIVSGHDSRDPDCPVCAALTAAAAVQPADWWRKRADEIELRVAQSGSTEAMRAFTDMRTLLQAAAAPKAEPVPAVRPTTLPLAITSAPERIWLDLGFNPYEEDAHFSNLHDLTWSEDNATGDGIEYVRADRAMRAQAAPAAVAGLRSGWGFSVNRSDGRVWLAISTPHGASATMSAAEKTGNGDVTIVAQVLDYLADSLAAPTTQAAPETRESLGKRLIGEMLAADAIATAACRQVAELPDRSSPEDWPEAMLVTHEELHSIVFEAVNATQAAPQPAEQRGDATAFQRRVHPWMLECFGAEIAADRQERNHRFMEEALELVQSTGCTQSEAHQLVDYVFCRPTGEPAQEAGGVMVTLAALCLANDLDMHQAGETELARIWTKMEAIRAKQAAKPKHSPLPAAPAAQGDAWRDLLWQIADALECTPCTADEVLPKLQTIAEDAARYRHLRACNSSSLAVIHITSLSDDDWHILTEGDADEAIDAARSQAKEGA